MEMRTHFGAKAKEKKAKEKEAKDDFGSIFRESVDRHTLGVDRHRFRPCKDHDSYKFIKVQICLKKLPYLHY